MNLSTGIVLPAEDSDRLCEVAGRMGRQPAKEEVVVRDLCSTPAK